MAATVFYSFYYKRDVHRVQLVQNMNALEGQPLLNSQAWEKVRRQGRAAVEKWIDDQMKSKRVVIVLVGTETASRPWVQHEITKAYNDGRSMLGIRIHGLSSMGEVDTAGPDPFVQVGFKRGAVPIFDPTVTTWRGQIDTQATYGKLAENLVEWSKQGVRRA